MDEIKDLEVFLSTIGEEVVDAEEESFLLFSQDIPSSNLGFVDAHASTIEVTIHNQEYSIRQSPTLLSSSRAGGTTGAVLWKITPLFAEWISSQSNPLWNHSLLSSSSTAVELGCGISGLIALTLGPRIRSYVATDQGYVQRLLRENLEANASVAARTRTSNPNPKPKPRNQRRAAPKPKQNDSNGLENVVFATLDWELDIPGSLRDSLGSRDNDGDKGFDFVVSCDCIYNEALVGPFVRTCADFCRLRPVYVADKLLSSSARPTVCIIAQQRRSPDVFEAWLRETIKVFRVWRVGDETLGDALGSGSGYVVHLLLLKG